MSENWVRNNFTAQNGRVFARDNRLWIVGIVDESGAKVSPTLCSGWSLVGIYSCRERAESECLTPRHFLVPTSMNRGPRGARIEGADDAAWIDIEYPRWTGPVEEIRLVPRPFVKGMANERRRA